ncbi:cache domain-containing protein [Methanosarcina sp.]|uniref:cache domain-containing protein n=1 Tax=Methanosarcina sp. TaxID=2213 RepID=UPI003C709050
MDLIKIACIMLAVALFLGILTSGGKDEMPAVSAELEGETIGSDVSGVAGAVQAEEESEMSEPAVSKPGPDPLTLEKGESKLAGERKNIESKVRATVRLIEAQGAELFPSFREEGSPWFQDGFCIFVWTADGTQLVCPSDQSREGKNIKGLKDADGRPIGELFIETALSKDGEGWIEYNWQDRNSSEPYRKCTFVKKVSSGGETYIAGADLYLENYIVCRNLEACKYTDEPGNLQIAELLNPLSLDRNLELNCSIAHSIINPGKNAASHIVKDPEIHYILEGQGLLYIDGIPVEIRPDQLVYIPAGAVQTTYNTGDTTLKFLIINQPARSEHSAEILD